MARLHSRDGGILNKLHPQRETYVDKIVENVEQRIWSGVIRPETMTSEVQLAKEYGVSRGPAREALNRLEDKGLVEKKHFGRRIRAFDIAEYCETYELRIIVEAYCAMQGSLKATEQDHENIRNLVGQMERNLSPSHLPKLRELAYRFHDYIVDCSQNKTLIDVFRSSTKKIRWASSVVFQLRDQKIDYKEHFEISEMFIKREAEKVRSLLERHTTTNMVLLLKEFEKKREMSTSR